MNNLDRIAYLEKQFLGANPTVDMRKQAITMQEVHKAHIHAGIIDADQRYINELAQVCMAKTRSAVL